MKLLNDDIEFCKAEPIIKNRKNLFKSKLELRDVSFKYRNNPEYTLKNINLEIKIGSKVGIIEKLAQVKVL